MNLHLVTIFLKGIEAEKSRLQYLFPESELVILEAQTSGAAPDGWEVSTDHYIDGIRHAPSPSPVWRYFHTYNCYHAPNDGTPILQRPTRLLLRHDHILAIEAGPLMAEESYHFAAADAAVGV